MGVFLEPHAEHSRHILLCCCIVDRSDCVVVDCVVDRSDCVVVDSAVLLSTDL